MDLERSQERRGHYGNGVSTFSETSQEQRRLPRGPAAASSSEGLRDTSKIAHYGRYLTNTIDKMMLMSCLCFVFGIAARHGRRVEKSNIMLTKRATMLHTYQALCSQQDYSCCHTLWDLFWSEQQRTEKPELREMV